MAKKNDTKKYITLLVLFRILRSISAGMIALTFPYLILQKLSYSSFILGLIYTAATIATAIFGILFGFMADIYGRKQTLIIVALLLPLSSFLIYVSNNLFILFLAAMLGGYSATGSLSGGGVGGAAQPIQNALIVDLTTPERRTFYFSILTFIAGVTAAIGSLIARVFTIDDAFLIATLISFLSVIVILPIKTRNTRGKMNKLESKIVIGKFSLTGIINGFTQGLVTPFLIPFFYIVYNIPKSEMSIYAFISGLIGSFALLLAPYLERYFGFVKSIAITRGLGAILTVLLPLIKILPVSLAIYFILPALRVAALPVQQSAMTEMVSQDEVGRALGINQVARLAASSTGTTLTGYLFDTPEIELPFYIYGVMMFINIYLYFKFFGNK
ncbi:MAG: MFS transporter [Thermoprotei archaeon]